MKSLEQRKAQRAEQRSALAHGGVIPLPGKTGEETKEGDNISGKDQFEDMTINQLKEWVKGQDGGAIEVPNDVTKRDDVLKFARNYAEYLTEKADAPTKPEGWTQQ